MDCSPRATLALYRFAPPTVAYGRAYLEQWDEVAALGTPAQAAVLQAPFAPRLQRKVAPREGDAGGEPTTFQYQVKNSVRVYYSLV